MSPVQGSDKLGRNSVTHAWIARDPQGRLVQKSIATTREGAWSWVLTTGEWDNARRRHIKLGWRVVKVELREVKP